MNLNWNSHQFQFAPVPMRFEKGQFADVFAEKNNKTLRKTLLHQRYAALAEETCHRYPKQLDTPLGEFLMTLKQNGDHFYLRFLNKYGDSTYVKFWIEDERVMAAKGLYLYQLHNTLQYIGEI